MSSGFLFNVTAAFALSCFKFCYIFQVLFKVGSYMEKQPSISEWMRSLLVDWMVEVQESFELNHETLYLAVKLVDLYLTKVVANKETLQLIGAAAMFIACKYDVSGT
jgi:cyclin B